MDFKFEIPTKVFFAEDCINKNKDLIKGFGKKALIITGKNSAKISGALDDVIHALDFLNMPYCLYDRILNNPDLANVNEGSFFARENNADFIIAIGGGSPLDGAKAISALCSNNIKPIELITNPEKIEKMIPIIAVPTTAGTGSEITPYSILTIPEMKTKKSFASSFAFPKISFLDYRYTLSLSDEITIDTAFDAFTHLLESYLSLKSNAMVEMISLKGIKLFSECINNIDQKCFNKEIREKLLYSSLLGGMAIAHTGTTIIHAMGYSLTYFKGLSHGRANTLFIRDYLKYNLECSSEKINNILELTKFDTIDSMGDFFERNARPDIKVSDRDIGEFAYLAGQQKSILNNPRKTGEKEMLNLYKNVLKKYFPGNNVEN